jgi:hypothetical protein
MTPLATEIYKQLRATLRTKTSITYGELAKLVSKKQPTHHRSPKLHAALTEVTQACRAHDLPAVTAMVWSATTNQPSAGYYEAAHPRSRTDESRHAAWEREHAAVIRDAVQYPATL